MASKSLSSASGLRPLSAFVVIASTLTAVLIRVVYLVATNDMEGRRLSVVEEPGTEPAYGIEDRDGAPLAVFLERLDLEMSPSSMWQAHTPGYMAARIADTLGPGYEKEEILAAMFPAEEGLITVESWPLDAPTALQVDRFLRGVEPFERPEGLLPGIGIASLEDGTHRIVWEPAVLLSKTTRSTFSNGRGPLTWSRRIADGLGDAVLGPLPDSASERERARRRERVWATLIPAGWKRVVLDVPPERVIELADVLRIEGVESHQMWFERVRERQYPAGDFPVLGHWGFLDEDQKAPLPYSGLERLCDRVLAGDEFAFIDRYSSSYSWRRERPARQGLRPYYLERVEAAEPPRVRVTLDISLQRMVRRRLEEVRAEHDPAMSLAMVVEVETGQVLAADGLATYGMAAFPPVKHLFMPGSTFKIVTMATALEAGAVVPEDTFEVGNGEWVLSVGGRARTIHEAEGSATGRITAAECLAHSVNAGLVQIGLQVDAAFFRGRLDELGYGHRPEAGLGGEEPGSIPALPWKTLYSHASVCYGYEVLTTSWQHMQALATILRGGVFRELSLVESLEHGGRRFDIPRGAERRVFARETCDLVRGMMKLGAREGTGKTLFRDDIVMGTKTGTAERVSTEVCLHVFGRRARALADAGVSVTKRDYQGLRGVREEHSTCHTSSILVFARLPESEREIAVLVVVDEPRSGERFGSHVAGPAAMDIVAEALGLTRAGYGTTPDLLAGFAPSQSPPGDDLEDEERDRPWRVR